MCMSMSLRSKMDAGSPGAGPYVCAEDWILVLLNPMVNSLLNLLTNPSPVALYHPSLCTGGQIQGLLCINHVLYH